MIQWELDLLNWVHSFSSPVMDSLMLGVTYAATMSSLWLVMAFGMLLVRRYRRAGAAIVLAVIVSYLVCDLVMKPLFGRTRPCEFADFEMIIAVPDSYSFPSGHTMSSFAAATMLTVMFGRKGVPALFFAGLVGLSRLYLFVHWPTDVMAGMVLGILAALALSWVLAGRGLLYGSKGGAGAP